MRQTQPQVPDTPSGEGLGPGPGCGSFSTEDVGQAVVWLRVPKGFTEQLMLKQNTDKKGTTREPRHTHGIVDQPGAGPSGWGEWDTRGGIPVQSLPAQLRGFAWTPSVPRRLRGSLSAGEVCSELAFGKVAQRGHCRRTRGTSSPLLLLPWEYLEPGVQGRGRDREDSQGQGQLKAQSGGQAGRRA